MIRQSFFPGIASLLASVLSMVLIVLLPTTSSGEFLEAIMLGSVGGIFAWGCIFLPGMVSSDITQANVAGSSRSRTPLFVCAAMTLAGALLILLFFSAVLQKPFFGLLVIVGFPICIGVLVFCLAAFKLIGIRSTRWLSGVLLILNILVSFFGPINERPAFISAKEVTSSEQLRLISWNIGLGQPLSRASQSDHLAHIASLVNFFEADVVCLQELQGKEHLALLLSLLGSEWIGAVSDGRRYRATAVLSRLPASFRSPAPHLSFGGPVVATLSTSRLPIEIASVHLLPERHAHQRKDYMLWLMNHFASTDSQHRIITGDFNIDPSGFWDRASSVFSDDLDLDRQMLERMRTHWSDAGAGTAATAVFSRRIDFAFLPEQSQLLHYEILHGTNVGRMDHYPILVTLNTSVQP